MKAGHGIALGNTIMGDIKAQQELFMKSISRRPGIST